MMFLPFRFERGCLETFLKLNPPENQNQHARYARYARIRQIRQNTPDAKSSRFLATLEMLPNEHTQTPQFAANNPIDTETKRRSA